MSSIERCPHFRGKESIFGTQQRQRCPKRGSIVLPFPSLLLRREEGAEQLLFETAGEPLTPRTVFVSTVVNQPVIQPFLFRNYRHRTEDRNHAHYQGSSDVRVWEAIMASTAAPGYFGEVKLGSHVLQVSEWVCVCLATGDIIQWNPSVRTPLK